MMIISDLNYLENTSEEIFGGRGTKIKNINNAYTKVKTVVNDKFTKTFNINSNGVAGNVADIVASADASGPNTYTNIVGGVQTESGRSETFLTATSVSGGKSY